MSTERQGILELSPELGRHGTEPVRTLIDVLLEEQRRLTAVERFSLRHSTAKSTSGAAGVYRELFPSTSPRPGEQYAFEVDLDRCSGCKACVTACHSLNGLDDTETWRDIGVLTGFNPRLESSPAASPASAIPWQQLKERPSAGQIPLQQTITTACHHCVEPGCLLGCPVKAYEKDPVTGIVHHLDDQCIGCSYCILKCPYDVPKYSERLGIVRKCDLCQGRLAVGEAPACVQACPGEAIRVTLVRPAAIRSEWRPTAAVDSEDAGKAWLPDSPDPRHTLPTTRYVSKWDLAGAISGDRGVLRLEPAHWPLVWMLVLSQMGVGVLLMGALLVGAGGLSGWMGLVVSLGALVITSAGLGAGTLHLGQPLKAWRSFLGWRTSWLSREMIAFGLLMPLLSAVVGLELIRPRVLGIEPILPAVWILTAVAGVIGVGTSAMIYIDTKRAAWRPAVTGWAFGGTTLLLGSAMVAVLFQWAGVWGLEGANRRGAVSLGIVATVVRTVLFLGALQRDRTARRLGNVESTLPFRVLRRYAGWFGTVRTALFTLSTVLGISAMIVPGLGGAVLATLSLGSTFAAQIGERWAYFVGCSPRRMPGLPQ